MIARIWEGRTKVEHEKVYEQFMKERAVPDYSKTAGFVKLLFLKRTDRQFAYFKLITFWKDLDVIKNFAGEDYEKAKYYPEDQNYLLEFPEKVIHFEVFDET
ncbi:MAG: antibiotic biosynthesis monooxygenase [Bacteroidota bacterium]